MGRGREEGGEAVATFMSTGFSFKEFLEIISPTWRNLTQSALGMLASSLWFPPFCTVATVASIPRQIQTDFALTGDTFFYRIIKIVASRQTDRLTDW